MDEHSGESFGAEDEALTPLQERLAALAASPLDADVAERCRARLQATRRPHRPLHLKLLPVAAAVAVLGSGVGLAAADTLPAPAQDVAHHALGAVGVHVPPGHERFNDAVECPGGPYRNHGAYVKAHKGDPNASTSRCGKPMKSGSGGDEGSDPDGTTPKDQQDGEHQDNGHHGNGHGKGNGQGQGNNRGDQHGNNNPGATEGDDDRAPEPNTPSTAPILETSPSTDPTPTTIAVTTTSLPSSTTTAVAATTSTTGP